MSKDRPTTGTDGLPLPILPPERDARVCGRLIRVMFYLPGFMALLLIKAGEPTAFGITVELLMLASATAIVGGMLFSTILNLFFIPVLYVILKSILTGISSRRTKTEVEEEMRAA